ncbi:MAG: PQQ-dependent sugar dehydrogenase [Acidimicrobiia bacterium]
MRKLVAMILPAVLAAACSSGETPASSSSLNTTTVSSGTAATTSTSAPDSTTAGSTATTAATTQALRPLADIVLGSTEVWNGFESPVLMLTPPNDSRLFVVEQPGRVDVIDGGAPEVFFDITDRVRFQGEQGLLGLAFPPDFADSDVFYLDYVNNDGDTVIASMRADGNVGLVGSLTEILRIDQPAANHNGGMVQFGPDGNLWIGMGDGGGANDQFGNGQREETPLAALLRITVGPGVDGYQIPGGNRAGEVWAIGLRNPWRWTFDGNDLWIADVGQNRIEEVDLIDWRDGTPNFGWSIQEGSSCFGGGDCDKTGLVQPLYEYTHDEGCSITGGSVYHGTAIPELAGQFFFGDYCGGWVRSIDKSGNVKEWFPARTFPGTIGFGVDAAGEIYVLTNQGTINRLVEAGN